MILWRGPDQEHVLYLEGGDKRNVHVLHVAVTIAFLNDLLEGENIIEQPPGTQWTPQRCLLVVILCLAYRTPGG